MKEVEAEDATSMAMTVSATCLLDIDERSESGRRGIGYFRL
jgi:hypothetical protein